MIKLKDLVLAHDDYVLMKKWCCNRDKSQLFGQSDLQRLSKTEQVVTNDKTTNKKILLGGSN